MALQQVVIVRLDGINLSDEIYESYDADTLEEMLVEIIEGSSLGEFDSTEQEEDEVVMSMHGPDAELLFAAIEPTLRSYPLCKGSKVEIRSERAGTPPRTVSL